MALSDRYARTLPRPRVGPEVSPHRLQASPDGLRGLAGVACDMVQRLAKGTGGTVHLEDREIRYVGEELIVTYEASL